MKTNTFPEISAIVIVTLALFSGLGDSSYNFCRKQPSVNVGGRITSICFPNPGEDRTSAHHRQSSANSIEIVGRSTRILGQQHPLFGGASNQGSGERSRT